MGRPIDLETLRTALDRPARRPTSDYDLNPEITLPAGRSLRPAAVLIGVAGDAVILTKRASHLKHHPGQIAFPGGKQEASDASPAAAALREAQEEIGLAPEQVRLLAELPPHETVTGYTVTPFLARIDDIFTPFADPGEVAEVFFVPLSFLMAPENYRVERRRWRGVWRHFYVVPYGPHYIWGATARMLRALAERAIP